MNSFDLKDAAFKAWWLADDLYSLWSCRPGKLGKTTYLQSRVMKFNDRFLLVVTIAPIKRVIRGV